MVERGINGRVDLYEKHVRYILIMNNVITTNWN